MLEAGAEHRYAYYAVTDHAPNLYMQRMTDEKMLDQRRRLRALQDRFPSMRLLHGTELNIDPDGGVDWDEDFLGGFDLTVASVHSHFAQSKDQMTRRVIRAIEHPGVNIIGHLTTRKIGRREPVDLDLEEVFEAAGRAGTALEINAYPDRLDLRDEHVLWARRHGVRFAIDTDARGGAPRHDALRRRDRSARLAHESRCDQRLADHQARAVPAEGRFLSRPAAPIVLRASGSGGRGRPARPHPGAAAARRRSPRRAHR